MRKLPFDMLFFFLRFRKIQLLSNFACGRLNYDNIIRNTRLGMKFNHAIDIFQFSSFLGISFVFPVAECDLSLTTQHKGVLSGITSIGIIVSSHFWGFLADQRGRKTIIVPTLVLSFLASFLSSLATNFTMLVIFRFICGFL